MTYPPPSAGPLAMYPAVQTIAIGGSSYTLNTAATFDNPTLTAPLGGPVGDDASQNVPIGFGFNFYGTNYTTAYICTNGFLSFTSSSATFTNVCLPNGAAPNAMIAAYWDDLITPPGSISYQTLGVAPNRRFVVWWNGVGHYQATGTTESFKIILDETTNKVTTSIISSMGGGSSATRGIENQAGDSGTQASCNQAGTAVTNTSQTYTPGSSYTYNAQILGPPGASLALMVDTVSMSVPIPPHGVLGVPFPPMVTFDGIGLGLPGSQPLIPPTIPPSGVYNVTLGAVPPSLAGQTFYVQAIAVHPSLPLVSGTSMGVALSTHGNAALPSPACRATLSVPSSVGHPFFTYSPDATANPTDWPIGVSDISRTYATGTAAIYYARSRVFHQNDQIQFKAEVGDGNYTWSNYRVQFELQPVTSVEDTYTIPTPSSPGYNSFEAYTWSNLITGPNNFGYRECSVAISLASLQQNQAYTVHASLQYFAAGSWTTVDSTKGASVPLMPSTESATSWRENIVYLTDARHIVLVHGWYGSVTTFGSLELLLETQSPVAHRRPVRVYDGDWFGPSAIFDQAGELNQFLTDPVYGVNASQVSAQVPDFVAHSMGGLVVRTWMTLHYALASGRTLVCLGTPHFGVPCADTLPYAYSSQGTVDMNRGSAFLRSLSGWWTSTPPQVRVLDVIGIGNDDNDHGYGDGLVPAYSANMREGGTYYSITEYQLRFLPGYWHTNAWAVPVGFPCAAPLGAQTLVPVNDTAHPSYVLAKEFLLGMPLSAGGSYAPNRTCVWAVRTPQQTSSVTVGNPPWPQATGMWTNSNPGSTDEVDVYVLSNLGALTGPGTIVIGGQQLLPQPTVWAGQTNVFP